MAGVPSLGRLPYLLRACFLCLLGERRAGNMPRHKVSRTKMTTKLPNLPRFIDNFIHNGGSITLNGAPETVSDWWPETRSQTPTTEAKAHVVYRLARLGHSKVLHTGPDRPPGGVRIEPSPAGPRSFIHRQMLILYVSTCTDYRV